METIGEQLSYEVLMPDTVDSFADVKFNNIVLNMFGGAIFMEK